MATDDADRGDARDERGPTRGGALSAADPPPLGWLDQRLLTPSAPLPPGAGVRVIPVALAPLPGSSVAPCWAVDPTGRHQLRWWGGLTWTDHVADDGVADEDPLHPID